MKLACLILPVTILCAQHAGASAVSLEMTEKLKQQINQEALAFNKVPCKGGYDASFDETIKTAEDFSIAISIMELMFKSSKTTSTGVKFTAQSDYETIMKATAKDRKEAFFVMAQRNDKGLNTYTCRIQ